VYQTRHGLKFAARAGTTDRGIINTVVAQDEYRTRELPQIKTVIDLGANIGSFSAFIAEKADKIYAFEPVLENATLARRTIELNTLNNKVILTAAAVSDHNGVVDLYLSPDNTGGHSPAYQFNKKISVPAVSLQSVFDAHKIFECDLLKIDIEGGEYEALYILP